jgi:RNA polymerase sigma-32 factor
MARLAADDEGLQVYLNTIQRFEPLDRETELRLARRWVKRHDARAAHALVEAHLRFVVKIAASYRGYGIRLADLIEEGNVGLMEAVKRFDPDRNLRFMTYAAYWIRAYILAHVLKQWSMVGVGTGPMQSKLFFRMARERAKIMSALGAGADESDVEGMLARKFGTTPERIRDMTGRLESKDFSLDSAAYRDGTVTALDMLPDHAEGQEDFAVRTQRDEVVRRRLGSLICGLSPRERYILDHRLLSDEEHTLADIGRHLGLSRERVRQLEERLKLKLRRVLAEFEPKRLRA